MKWFSHEARASRDVKLRKLLMKYGYEGYGLYWYCLENICLGLEPDLSFELEQDSEILAHEGKMDTLKVEECMKYMVSLELFDVNESGVISCLKLARFLGEKSTRNNKLKEIIREAKGNEKSKTVRDSPRLSPDCPPDMIRDNKIREEKEKGASRFTPPTLDQVQAYVKEKNYRGVNCELFMASYETKGWMVGKNKMKCWKSAVAMWNMRQKEFSGNDKAPSASDRRGV